MAPFGNGSPKSRGLFGDSEVMATDHDLAQAAEVSAESRVPPRHGAGSEIARNAFQKWLYQRPWWGLGLALTAGLLIGFWVKRK